MLCFVYASHRKSDTYVWLSRRDDFDCLPAPLLERLGTLRFVLDVDITETRQLPHADSRAVLAALRSDGWYLQLPPAHD